MAFKNKAKQDLHQSLLSFLSWYIQQNRWKTPVKTKEYYLSVTPKSVFKFIEASNHYIRLSLQDKYQTIFYCFEFEFKKLSIEDAVVITYTTTYKKQVVEGKFAITDAKGISEFLVKAITPIQSEAYAKHIHFVMQKYLRTWID